MRRAGVQPALGVLEVHAAAEMQSAGKRGQRFGRGCLVARSQLDDMAALQPIPSIQFREPGRGTLGHKIRAQPRAVIAQTAADDLLDLAFMQVDARTKHAANVDGRDEVVEGVWQTRRDAHHFASRDQPQQETCAADWNTSCPGAHGLVKFFDFRPFFHFTVPEPHGFDTGSREQCSLPNATHTQQQINNQSTPYGKSTLQIPDRRGHR